MGVPRIAAGSKLGQGVLPPRKQQQKAVRQSALHRTADADRSLPFSFDLQIVDVVLLLLFSFPSVLFHFSLSISYFLHHPILKSDPTKLGASRRNKSHQDRRLETRPPLIVGSFFFVVVLSLASCWLGNPSGPIKRRGPEKKERKQKDLFPLPSELIPDGSCRLLIIYNYFRSAAAGDGGKSIPVIGWDSD